ncbi:MAG TPA: hypothetical protein VGG10_21955 [Rhizomicrobium sp.]|jgi:hypothetical protein
MTARDFMEAPADTTEAMLARLKPLQDALKKKQIDPNDTRTGAEITEELYDELGLPR